MNAIGYSAGTVGNHEFDYGQTVLRARLRDARFPILSANLETPIAEIRPYTVVTAKGIRFGIVGVTTEELRTSTHPKRLGGVRAVDIVKALERVLPEVRSRSDFIVVTAHLTDAEEKRLSAAFPEIRLIVGGHNHGALGPLYLGQTVVAKTGSVGRNVGRVDLDFDGKRLTKIEARLIPVRRVARDPEVSGIVDRYQSSVAAQLAEIVGEASAEFTKSDAGESALANLVADAYRARVSTDVGLVNLGGIRASIARGPISWGAIFEVFPFRDTLVTAKLTGAQLKRVLGRRLLGISGLRIRYDLKQPAGRRLVSAALANGTPLDDSKLYSVALNDFMSAGGDGFSEFSHARDLVDTGAAIRDVLSAYVKGRRVIAPVLDGRVALVP
jgi:2',3'-cyclic-nucleotide 2'-phosphodiesterase (5'-nucleotidase family)